MSKPSLSVVIPTYRRPDSLLRTLESLRHQSYKKWEVIIVDNAGGDDEVRELVNDFGSSLSLPVSLLTEKRTGVHYARHTGAKAASSDILVFTDDDATFDEGWLDAYAAGFERHSEIAAAAGPVMPRWEKPPPKWLSSLVEGEKVFTPLSLMEPYDRETVDKTVFFFSINMAIRKEVLFALGGFHPENTAGDWVGDGETGLNLKIWANEMLIAYFPDALVYHHIPPSRMTETYFVRRWHNQGAADAYTKYHPAIPHRLFLVFSALGICFRQAAGELRSSLRPRRTRGSATSRLRRRMRLAYSRGFAAYSFRLLFDKHLRELVSRSDWISTRTVE